MKNIGITGKKKSEEPLTCDIRLQLAEVTTDTELFTWSEPLLNTILVVQNEEL